MSNLDRSKIDYINKKLTQDYGYESDLRPKFRLVWSEDEFEDRFSTFVDYSESGIFLREVTEARHVYKYPWRGCYLLEKTNGRVITKEILTHNGYECVYKLPEDKELNPRAVYMLVHWLVTGSIARGKNVSEYTDEKEKQERLKELNEEKEFFEDFLKDQGTEFGLGYGEAVSFSGLDARKSLKENTNV